MKRINLTRMGIPVFRLPTIRVLARKRGADTLKPPVRDYGVLLLESGGKILLESGGYIKLENQ